MQNVIENYIITHYYLIYSAPVVITGIILMVFATIRGNRVWNINKNYWQNKRRALGIDKTTTLKGTSLSWREKQALKVIEKGSYTLSREWKLWRMLFWCGFIFLTIGVVWGYFMRLNIISYL